MDRDVGGVEVEHLSGLSDVTALVEWKFDHESPWTFVAGLQLPTGEDKENPAPGVVPPSLLQLGSGTWDPILGVTWTAPIGPVDAWASAAALIPLGESDAGLEPGITGQLSVGGSLAVVEDLRLSFGLEDTMRGSDSLLGQRLDNTASTVIGATAGVAWRFAETWALGVQARVPFYYDMDGTQLVPGTLYEFAVDWTP